MQKIKNEDSLKQESPVQNSKQKVRFNQVSGYPTEFRTNEIVVVDVNTQGEQPVNGCESVARGGEVPKGICEQNVIADASQGVDRFQIVEHDENPGESVKGVYENRFSVYLGLCVCVYYLQRDNFTSKKNYPSIYPETILVVASIQSTESDRLSIHPFIYLPICPCVSLSVYLAVCWTV